MSQENVEIVRRYYEAVQRAFTAYWKGPRSVADSLKEGQVGPEGVEMIRYLHPNVEWTTALTGITYRGYSDLASGFDELMEAARNNVYATRLVVGDRVEGPFLRGSVTRRKRQNRTVDPEGSADLKLAVVRLDHPLQVDDPGTVPKVGRRGRRRRGPNVGGVPPEGLAALSFELCAIALLLGPVIRARRSSLGD
jgi:hypothetical protein